MSLKIVTLEVGELRSNCYLLIDKATSESVIIDSGDAGGYIIDSCQREGVKPNLILATHGHFDHIMATTEIKLAYKIPFFINKKDKFLVERMNLSAKHFLGIDTDPAPDIDGYLNEGDKIKIGDVQLEVIEVPGHTPGSICLYEKNEGLLFVGDLVFAGGGIGRTDFSYSSYPDIADSILKVFRLPAETQIYPGHGHSSTLSEECQHHDGLIF